MIVGNYLLTKKLFFRPGPEVSQNSQALARFNKTNFPRYFLHGVPFAKFFENCHAARDRQMRKRTLQLHAWVSSRLRDRAPRAQLATADPGSSVVELLTEDFIECAD
jgi:hypothetical protein